MALFGTRGLTTFFGLALLPALFSPPSLTIDPANVLKSGTTASITYSNSSKANQSVTVTVSGGVPVVSYNVVIQLDTDGNGTGTWEVVSGWRSACFNAPDVEEVTVAVTH